jgi:hypothetical protein
MDEDHSTGKIENNLEIIKKCRKGFILDTLEEFHIYKALKSDSNLVLNDKLKYNSHVLFNKILDNQVKRTIPYKETPLRTSSRPR